MSSVLKDILADPHFPERSAWKRYSFEANQLIFNEGDLGGTLFYIEQGKLRVFGNVELETHKLVHTGIWELIAGDIFGEIALHKTQYRTATVKAYEAGQLVEINGEKLSIYLDEHPSIGYLFYKELFEILTARLSRANHRVNELFAWGLKVHEIDQHL